MTKVQILLIIIGIIIMTLYIFYRKFVATLYIFSNIIFIVSITIFFMSILWQHPFNLLSQYTLDKTHLKNFLISIDNEFNKVIEPLNDLQEVNNSIKRDLSEISDKLSNLFKRENSTKQNDIQIETRKKISYLNLEGEFYSKLVYALALFYRIIFCTLSLTGAILALYLKSITYYSKLFKKGAYSSTG